MSRDSHSPAKEADGLRPTEGHHRELAIAQQQALRVDALLDRMACQHTVRTRVSLPCTSMQLTRTSAAAEHP